jgi:hypothetical protein
MLILLLPGTVIAASKSRQDLLLGLFKTMIVHLYTLLQ